MIKMNKRLIYIAAPLFSIAERDFNLTVAKELEALCLTFLPQRDGDLLAEKVAQGLPVQAASQQIFDIDVAAIKSCDLMIAVLDGRSIDEGVAFEIGLAYCLGKTCIGLQTDTRRLLPLGNNPMIACALTATFASCRELIEALGTNKTHWLSRSAI